LKGGGAPEKAVAAQAAEAAQKDLRWQELFKATRDYIDLETKVHAGQGDALLTLSYGDRVSRACMEVPGAKPQKLVLKGLGKN